MKYNETGAFILSETKNGERIVSCGGRISTRPGSAVELYKKATDKDKNLNLIKKVVSSGHKTVLEHHYFNIAFNNVSIFIEQYLIEFRLASYTIKSGRYVNFSKAGFNLPNGFSEEQKTVLKKHYKNMFKIYDKFVQAGVPVEDARFVLPYGLKTNIYMSLNARELIHVICTMIYGRGSHYEEIKALGLQLKEQFDERYPGLVEASASGYTSDLSNVITANFEKCKDIEYVRHTATLVQSAENASEKLDEYARFCGYQKFDFKTALHDDKLSKMLEHFNYTFKVENFALIILKHYTRHRMQALSTEPIFVMAGKNKFVMPDSIAENAELKADFERAIKENRKIYNKFVEQNVGPYLMIYVTPHATAIDFVTTLNARELLHIANLRTCNRAQWEIRNLATEMIRQLKKLDREMFKMYGPSCYTFGVCPEGRLCCGKQAEMKQKFDTLE